MIDKKMLFLLLLLASGVYFFKKKETNILIIICLFAVFFLINNNNNNEHLTSQEQLEAIQNVASMYNNGVLTASALNVTGNLTVGGNSTLSGNLAVGGNSTLTGDVTAANTVYSKNINNSNNFSSGNAGGSHATIDANGNLVTNKISAYGNITFMEPKSGLVFDNFVLASAGPYLTVFRKSDGQVLLQADENPSQVHATSFASNLGGASNVFTNSAYGGGFTQGAY